MVIGDRQMKKLLLVGLIFILLVVGCDYAPTDHTHEHTHDDSITPSEDGANNVIELEGTWIIIGGEEQESSCNPSELNFGENQNPCAGYMQFDENLTGSYYVCCDGSAILVFNMTAVLSESEYTVTKTSGSTSGSTIYLIVNDDETITAYPEVDDGGCMIHVFSQGTPDCSNCTECN